MASLYYSFALNAEAKLTNINDAIKGQKYFCPVCGAPMITKMGNERRWHFAHKNNIHECSYESYIHKLAKRRIADCFNKSEKFIISFHAKSTCGVSECPLGSTMPCSWFTKQEFDLKKYYNKCAEEVSIDNFVADLLISDSENPKKPPILIEICVTHKSTEQKLKSDNRIIEIVIKSEKDIEDIVSTSSIVESEGYVDKWDTKPNEQIRFYNFKCDKFEMPDHSHQALKFRFWIDSKGRFKFDNDMYKSEKCLTPNPPDIENSIFRIESKMLIDWDLAFSCLENSKIGIKCCAMCGCYRMNDHYTRPMCILYKSKGTKQFPPLKSAMNCNYFRPKVYSDVYQEYRIYIKPSKSGFV